MRKMKDSRITGIGNIPETWSVTRIKNVFFEVNERTIDSNENSLLSVSEYYGVEPRINKTEEGDFVTRAESLDGYKKCKSNDLVMNIMLAWKKALGVSKYDGIVSPAYCVYRTKANVNPTFFHYLFRTQAYAELFKQYSTGIIDSRLRLYPDKFLSLYCCFPSIEEQKKIVGFLDNMCSQIDSLINKQETIIEKLKEYKLAIITETATKGLLSNAKMKDSGNRFIGLIPEHWRCSSIRHLHNGLTDGTHGTYQRYDTGRLLLSSKNVREDSLEIGADESYICEEDYKDIVSNGFPRKNDLLLCCIGASIGRCILYDRDEPEAFQRSVIMIRSGKYILPKYFLYCMKSSFVLQQEQILANQSAQPGLYQGLVGSIFIPVPEIEEQKQIICYLDEKCSSIGKSIASKQKIIDCLKEYKKSLIYEVITGKMEV